MRKVVGALPGYGAASSAPDDLVGVATARLHAENASVLIADRERVFRVAASSDPLVGPIVLDRLDAALWSVVVGQRVACWPEDALPELAIGRPGWGRVAAAGLPLRHGRQGLLVVGRDEPPWSAAELSDLDEIAVVGALLMDRRRADEQLAGVARMLTAAVHAASAVAAAGTPHAVRDAVVAALVDDLGLAGAALFEQTPAGGLHLVRAVGMPLEVRDQLGSSALDAFVTRVTTGRLNPQLLRGLMRRVSTVWPGRDARLVRLQAPIEGALVVFSDRALPDAVDGVLETFAQALSDGVKRAEVDERTRRLMDSFIDGLSPDKGEVPATLDVGYVYRPATRGVPIGGDFIDWFATEGQHFGIACGDVSGKGAASASLTAMAVYTIRAFARRGASPRMLARMVNSAVLDQTEEERFVTLAYARVEPDLGEVDLVLAGHPRPLLVAGGTVRPLGLDADLPLGLFAEADYSQHHLCLDPGDALVVYTDGVTEAPSSRSGLPSTAGDGRLGERGVVAALRQVCRDDASASAQDLAVAVWETVERWSGGETADDCAVVVLARR